MSGAASLVPINPTDQQEITWYEIEEHSGKLRQVTAQYHAYTTWEAYRARYGCTPEVGAPIVNEWMMPQGRNSTEGLRRTLDRAVCFVTLADARAEALSRIDGRLESLEEQMQDLAAAREEVVDWKFYSLKPWGVR